MLAAAVLLLLLALFVATDRVAPPDGGPCE